MITLLDLILLAVFTGFSIWLMYTDWGTFTGWMGLFAFIPAVLTWRLRYKKWRQSK